MYIFFSKECLSTGHVDYMCPDSFGLYWFAVSTVMARHSLLVQALPSTISKLTALDPSILHRPPVQPWRFSAFRPCTCPHATTCTGKSYPLFSTMRNTFTLNSSDGLQHRLPSISDPLNWKRRKLGNNCVLWVPCGALQPRRPKAKYHEV